MTVERAAQETFARIITEKNRFTVDVGEVVAETFRSIYPRTEVTRELSDKAILELMRALFLLPFLNLPSLDRSDHVSEMRHRLREIFGVEIEGSKDSGNKFLLTLGQIFIYHFSETLPQQTGDDPQAV